MVEFLHPTEFDVGCGTADDRQRFAISMLLTAACEQPWTLMKRHERDALRDAYARQRRRCALWWIACNGLVCGPSTMLRIGRGLTL